MRIIVTILAVLTACSAACEDRLLNTRDYLDLDRVRVEYGCYGHGETAAIVDTFIREEHGLKGKVKERVSVSGELLDPYDHGTKMAQIIAGNGYTEGLAPLAELVSVKSTRGRSSSREDMVKALRWCLDNADRLKIGVVNISQSTRERFVVWSRDFPDQTSGQMQDVISDLFSKGILVCCSAGNRYHELNAIGSGVPASIPESVSVGALFSKDFGKIPLAETTDRDRLVPFSQRHPGAFDQRLKTDLFSPGFRISEGHNFVEEIESSGTSQATAVVSGCVLLIREVFLKTRGRYPNGHELLHILRSGGTVFDGDDEDDSVPNTMTSYNKLDILRSLREVSEPTNSYEILATEKATLRIKTTRRGTTKVSLKVRGVELDEYVVVTIGRLRIPVVANGQVLAKSRYKRGSLRVRYELSGDLDWAVSGGKVAIRIDSLHNRYEDELTLTRRDRYERR